MCNVCQSLCTDRIWTGTVQSLCLGPDVARALWASRFFSTPAARSPLDVLVAEGRAFLVWGQTGPCLVTVLAVAHELSWPFAGPLLVRQAAAAVAFAALLSGG